MGSLKKWGVEHSDSDKCYVVLYVSRNKDNKDLEGFKERRKSFICTEERLSYYGKQFDHFVEDGIVGEMCRMYVSVNARSMKAVRKELMHYLIDDEEFNLCSIESKLAGVASKASCAIEKKWLIDFDSTDRNLAMQLCNDITTHFDNVECDIRDTPHGFAIICTHGFDYRAIWDNWKEIAEIKKDDMHCVYWWTKD
jgi:hypothetical protein